MAHQWEMQMTMDHYGMGIGGSYSNYSNINAAQMNSASVSNVNPAYYYGVPSNNDSVRVDEMLDFSHAQELFPIASASPLADHNHLIAVKAEQSQTASARNSVSSYDSFANEFYVPSDEAAELEWLSKFVDDSYSDMPSNMGANMANFMNVSNETGQLGAENSSASAGRGARSKRSRATSAIAAAWHSLIPPPQSSPSTSSSSSDLPSKPSKGGSANRGKKAGIGNGGTEVGLEGGVRRCTHCASEKTPQWRTGPLGPKTLCNACGVRFKSGRLMPEYRPAASPTFVLTQHSNSHRKVMELRRQKEMIMIRHRDNPSAAAAAAANAAAGRPEMLYHDYGVC
ncbi:GATA transcription factor 2 [Carex rostrata]